MAWQDKYLCKPVKIKGPILIIKDFLTKNIKKFFYLLFHSLVPHKPLEFPEKEVPVNKFDDNLKKFAHEMYIESKSRISKLEEKSFKLLSFISLTLVLAFFIYVRLDLLNLKIFVIIAIVCAIWALIISFRCLNVKESLSPFLPAIYNFPKGRASIKTTKNYLSKAYIQCSIYNNAVGDNIADILNAARSLLFICLLIIMICSFFMIFVNNDFKIDINYNDLNLEEIKKISKSLDTIKDKFETFANSSKILIEEKRKINENIMKGLNELIEQIQSIEKKYNLLPETKE